MARKPLKDYMDPQEEPQPSRPVDPDDLRYDDREYDPEANPPKDAKAWLNRLRESERAFNDFNDSADKIEQRYASLMQLRNMARDKQFQMFWSNMEILKPAIYARPPVPVVTPKFKDRRPVPQAASEMLERCCSVAFDLTRIDDKMKLVRNDLAMLDRAVLWCRYEGKKGRNRYATERVCVDLKHRRDFLHSLSRYWFEVTWVAGAAYLTRPEARERFSKTSGKTYQDADYRVDRDSKEIGGSDGRARAKFWEIWDKDSERVIWVADGCESILDEDDPHLELQNFFPCPQPAYGTVQPGSLVPVPSILQYKDQLDELDLLTSRIHALSDALEAKGFYPAGTSEIAEAVQAAVAHNTPSRVLVPISNWAAFGGTKDVIIWLPIDMIAQTVTALVALRKEVIQDIYQIVGLSDIMRGATDPQETLGAQQLKMQSGSARVRDKQMEIVRLARDTVEVFADIITEKFDPVTMIEMSQTDLVTQKMQDQQVQAIAGQLDQLQQLAHMANTPQGQQLMQQQPDLMQQGMQMMQQGQVEIRKIQSKPTLEQVLTFLDNNRSRAFVLDIETDSTIQLDDNAEKQQRGEFLQMLGGLLPQLSAMVTAQPKAAKFAGELLKFAVAPFRAGRSLDGSIDELVETMEEAANQPQGPQDPTLQVEQMKDQLARDKMKSDDDNKQKDRDQKDAHKKAELENDVTIERMRLNAKKGEADAKMVQANQQAIHDREEHQANMIEKQQDIIAGREKNAQDAALGRQKLAINQQEANQRSVDRQQQADERRAQQQFKLTQQATRPQNGGPVR